MPRQCSIFVNGFTSSTSLLTGMSGPISGEMLKLLFVKYQTLMAPVSTIASSAFWYLRNMLHVPVSEFR